MATETWSIPTTPARDQWAVLAELRGASKRFGSGAAAVDAVRDVDLTIRSGELLAVLGGASERSFARVHLVRSERAEVSMQYVEVIDQS